MENDKVHGEGNYEASKQYNDATRKFAQSGKVEEAARNAAPKDSGEAQQLKNAEEAGKRRAKGEDPELYGGDKDEDRVNDGTEDSKGNRP